MTHRLPRCSRGELLLTLFYALSRGVCCSIRLGDVPNRGLRIRMAHDISLAMHYLHSRQIVHRGKAAVKSMHGVPGELVGTEFAPPVADLKSANVLVTSDLRCKVTDFGARTSHCLLTL